MRSIRIHQQLRAAFAVTGWSVQELLERSGLKLDRSSLWKKLNGTIPMRTSEAEVLAGILGVTVVWPPRASAA